MRWPDLQARFSPPDSPPQTSRDRHIRQHLSPKLPDPPVFTGDRSKFEDWKLKILTKLDLNSDHYPSEPFKIAYTLSRLGGKAVEHTLCRRRPGAKKPYLTIQDLLDHMIDLFETPVDILDYEEIGYRNTLQQGNRSFAEFYADFSKLFGEDMPEKNRILQLQSKLNNSFLDQYMNSALFTDPSFSKQKDHLLRMDHMIRIHSKHNAVRDAMAKSRLFAEQCSKAEAEAMSRKKYTILRRGSDSGYDSDLEVFKR